MREIKARGKPIGDSKDFVYGFYASKSNHYAIGAKIEHFILVPVYGDWGMSGFEEIKVYPESVGEYTGLKDKNGKEIYEGDIINYSSVEFIGIVKYTTSPQTRFYLDEIGGNDFWHELYSTSDIEIIGNICENHKLLEVK